jgi:hypothetical protein
MQDVVSPKPTPKKHEGCKKQKREPQNIPWPVKIHSKVSQAFSATPSWLMCVRSSSKTFATTTLQFRTSVKLTAHDTKSVTTATSHAGCCIIQAKPKGKQRMHKRKTRTTKHTRKGNPLQS